MQSTGSLIVKTLAADEAIPIPDSTVRIRGAESGNADTIHTLFTDEDGVTEIIRLPAPDVSLSLSPAEDGSPFATYNVTVVREGYYSKVVENVAVFPDTLSVLTVVMIPYVSYADGGRYPRENLISNT